MIPRRQNDDRQIVRAQRHIHVCDGQICMYIKEVTSLLWAGFIRDQHSTRAAEKQVREDASTCILEILMDV